MGALSTKKFIKNNLGNLTEEAALTTSSGASDAQKLPALNAGGVLDLSITNGKASSAGAGDAGKLAALDASGRLDTSLLPSGIGADTAAILTSEVLSAGNLINIYNNAGTVNVRKADATSIGKEAHGFVLAAFGAGVLATVYFEGTNASVAGQLGGDVFLSTTAGMGTSVAPTASGNVQQPVGLGTSPTSMNFQYNRSIALA